MLFVWKVVIAWTLGFLVGIALGWWDSDRRNH